MNVGFPFRLDDRGRLEDPDHDEHIRQLIMQVLFTNPGERVNRPDFGAGLRRVPFQAQSDEMLAATQHLVRTSLERWLGELIEIEHVALRSQDEKLEVKVRYVVRRDDSLHAERFTSG